MGFIEEAKRTGRITPESIAAGKTIAALAEKAVARVEQMGEPDERCSSCAFIQGTPPNQCADTLSDAMKCVTEKEPFYCHDKTRSGKPCHGWFAIAVVTRDMPAIRAPFPFSHLEGKDLPASAAPTAEAVPVLASPTS